MDGEKTKQNNVNYLHPALYHYTRIRNSIFTFDIHGLKTYSIHISKHKNLLLVTLLDYFITKTWTEKRQNKLTALLPENEHDVTVTLPAPPIYIPPPLILYTIIKCKYKRTIRNSIFTFDIHGLENIFH